MISVIIPTMWFSDYLPEMVQKYLACEHVGEVLVIDNNPKKKQALPGARIIYSGPNIYVNPAWEMGIEHSRCDYILLANDDIFIQNLDEILSLMVKQIGRHQIIGLEDIPCKQPLGISATPNTNYVINWGSFMFFKKSDYHPIPSEYRIMVGDWWLWMALNPMFLRGVKGQNKGSLTVKSHNVSHIMNCEEQHFQKTYKPPKKILHLIMSCNRPQYLVQSLNSLNYLHHSSYNVHRVLIDDYPNGRNNDLFVQLAKSHNIDELILNTENKGLSVVWHELYERFKNQHYDYVLHQEDDVILNERITLHTLLQALDKNKKACSVILARQPWYADEMPCQAKTDDQHIGHFRLEQRTGVFSPMFSFYPAWIMKPDYKSIYGHYPNETTIMNHWKNHNTVLLKNKEGKNLITHIGDTKTGRIILENEPGWDRFSHYDPNKKYCSKTGKELSF